MNRRVLIAVLLIWASVASQSLSAQTTWRRTFGYSSDESGSAVHQTSDGGYITVGTTGTSWQGGSDVYLLKLDSDGVVEWSKTFGTAGVEEGIECAELADGFIVAANTSQGDVDSYDMMLIRTDLLGNELWRKHYGKVGWDLCNSFYPLNDGYLLGGITYGPGSAVGNAYVVRTDLAGDTLWTKALVSSEKSECLGIIGTSDTGILLAGYIETGAGDTDGRLVKLDLNGLELWAQNVGGTEDDYFHSVAESVALAEYATSGGSMSFGPEMQISLQAFGISGTPTWDQHLGAGAAGSDIEVDHSGGYVITGYSSLSATVTDIILTVFSPGGWFQFGNNFGNGTAAEGLSVDTTSDGGYVLAGWSSGVGSGVRSLYVVKTDGAGQTLLPDIDVFHDAALDVAELDLSAQPYSIQPSIISSGGSAQISGPVDEIDELRIFNVQGAMLRQVRGSIDPSLDISSLPAGSYLLHLIRNKQTFTSKFTILR